MGWKTFFFADRAFFERKWNMAEYWGSLYPIRVVVGGDEYYGAGLASSSPEYGLSEKIRLPSGYKCRISAKLLLIFKAGTTGSAGCYGAVYDDGNVIPDEEGYSAWGVRFTLASPQPSDVASFHGFDFVIDRAKVSAYCDGELATEATLKLDGRSVMSSVIALAIHEVGGAQDLVVIMVYEVKGEYYDWMEDVVAQVVSIMGVVMAVMMMVVPLSLMIGALKEAPKKKERAEAERK